MKTKHFILYILFCCSTFLLNAQSNANFYYGPIISDNDFNDKISYNIMGDDQGLRANNCISDPKGNLLFYTKKNRIYDASGSIINNGSDIYLNTSSLKGNHGYDSAYWVGAYSNFIRINENTFYLVANAHNYDIDTAALMYSVIKKDLNGNWSVKSKNTIIKIGNANNMNINRDNGFDYSIVTAFDSSLYYFTIRNGVIQLKDSIFQNMIESPDSNYSTYTDNRHSTPHKMLLNSFGNHGYLFKKYDAKLKDSRYSNYNCLILYRFYIDKKTDKFHSIELLNYSIFLKSLFHDNLEFDTYNPYLMPNDSLIVFTLNPVKYGYYKDSSILIMYKLYENKIDTFELKELVSSLKISPSGNLIIFSKIGYTINDSSGYHFYTIYNTNQLKTKTLSKNNDSAYFIYNRTERNKENAEINNYFIHLPTYQLFDYLRIEPKINYSCDSVRVKLKNLTNLSNGINDFRFYVCQDSACNQVDSFRTFEPVINFTKNGKYPYKVYGYSPSQTGYGEWYYDTIIVNNKMKVHADFSVSDSVICRYKDVNFTNKSIASDTILGIISSHWYFANEKDSVVFGDNQDIKYAFTQTGIRNVKLVYGSGFCTDTFTKNIEVIDAPMPGFSVNNLVGCTPFELIINDTITRFVSQKEYYNSYKNSWDTIPLNQFNFSYNFPEAGNYFIIQKLVGANNCVTIRDTANITVRPGITNQDSTQIFYASYLDNQNIELIWNANSAARNYHLFSSKDGNIYKDILETNDTFYTHNIQNPQTIYYIVKAIDSCGTATITSNFAKPIFLETNLFGQNEKAMLDFTAYEKWQQNIQNYNVFVLDTFGNTQQVYITNPTHFEDENITEYDLSKICYQISTPHPTLNKEIKSNTSCINVLPTIFIPNSFTPNNDGLNEVFYPSILGIEYYDLYIYNRWGQLVGNFNKDNHWTGKNNPEGIYIYYIRAKTSTGKIINGKGNITLLR